MRINSSTVTVRSLAIVPSPERRRLAVNIGCRWTPSVSMRRDGATGAFESVNSMAAGNGGQIEVKTQLALLAPLKDARIAARIEAARCAKHVSATPQS